MLRLTADPRVADELELSTLNAVLAYHSVSGRWVTYDTPDDGSRHAAHAVNSWQSRPGAPELNCCSVNGQPVPGAEVLPGTYLSLSRSWRAGDRVVLDLDLAMHCWSGHNARAGLTALYRGPLLLAVDARHNDVEPDVMPALDARRLDFRTAPPPDWLPPALLLELTAAGGHRVRLCDFASAGDGGTRYRSWLPVEHVGAARPQHFASTVEQRLRAEIGRHAHLYRACRTADGSERRRPLLVRLCRERPAFVEHCARARALIDQDPDDARTRSLAEVLARIEAESDLLNPTCGARLRRELERSAAEPVCTLSDWRVRRRAARARRPRPRRAIARLRDLAAATAARRQCLGERGRRPSRRAGNRLPAGHGVDAAQRARDHNRRPRQHSRPVSRQGKGRPFATLRRYDSIIRIGCSVRLNGLRTSPKFSNVMTPSRG